MLTYSSKINMVAQKKVQASLDIYKFRFDDQVHDILQVANVAIESLRQAALKINRDAKKPRFEDPEDKDDEGTCEPQKGETHGAGTSKGNTSEVALKMDTSAPPSLSNQQTGTQHNIDSETIDALNDVDEQQSKLDISAKKS
ncbi:hypothetical protein L6452_30960 [Arctium lappa]|uniref:Uncharacterized protein n=1 Tax=Arctium lappa TaxID=4217 RepID=A0ACB8ZJ61_ARCLA|nr:hypothetical protein L6452_30960 [Arctium lappa]